MSKSGITRYNIWGERYTTRVFLVWRVGTCASAIVHLSYPGVVLLGQALVIIMRFLAYEGINQNFSENFFEARRKAAVKE